jgi:hypothetical protein
MTLRTKSNIFQICKDLSQTKKLAATKTKKWDLSPYFHVAHATLILVVYPPIFSLCVLTIGLAKQVMVK